MMRHTIKQERPSQKQFAWQKVLKSQLVAMFKLDLIVTITMLQQSVPAWSSSPFITTSLQKTSLWRGKKRLGCVKAIHLLNHIHITCRYLFKHPKMEKVNLICVCKNKQARFDKEKLKGISFESTSRNIFLHISKLLDVSQNVWKQPHK